jgi:hypothetical protein
MASIVGHRREKRGLEPSTCIEVHLSKGYGADS